MLEHELVALVKSFLRKRRASPTIEECLAWEEFFHVYDAVIRVSIARVHRAVHVIDDVTQDVWIIVIRRLPKWVFDPTLGAIGAWVAKIASRLAARRPRRHSRTQTGSLSAPDAETLADPEPGPDAEFERMQEHELFGDARFGVRREPDRARWPHRRDALGAGMSLIEDRIRSEHVGGCRVVVSSAGSNRSS